MPTRRQTLLTATAALQGCAWAGPSFARTESTGGLGAVARRKGVTVGVAVGSAQLRQNPDFASVIAGEGLGIVPEWEMKWHALRASRSRFEPAGCDALASRAQEWQVPMRGHPIVWYASMPAWALEAIREGQGETLLRGHIDYLSDRYGGVIDSWDVVNEAVWLPDRQVGGLRKGVWLEAMGPRYLDVAFQHASRRLPRHRLVYNDYNIEYERAKGDAVLRLVARVRSRGGRVDAVGLQSHLWSTRRRLDLEGLTAFLRQCKREAIDVVITELDVRESSFDDSISQRDRAVSGVVRAYLSTVFAEAVPKELFFWGLSDRYSWLSSPRYNPENPQGHVNRGLPLDVALAEKPMWLEVKNLLGALPDA